MPYGLPIGGQPLGPRTADDVLAELAGLQEPEMPEPGQFQTTPFEGFLERIGSVGLPDVPAGGGAFSDFLGGLTGTLQGRGQQIARQRQRFEQQSDKQRAERNAANLEASRERRRRLFEELNQLRGEERAISREEREAARRRDERAADAARREAEMNPRAVRDRAYNEAAGRAQAALDFPNPRTDPTTKPATPTQLTATNFYNRAADAVKQATEGGLEDRIAGRTGMASYELRAPNVAQGGDSQAYNAAIKAFALAFLRKESGAAISPQEYRDVAATYFAQPGDKPGTLAKKKRARDQVLEGLRIQTGPQSDATGATSGPAPINPASFWEAD